MLRSVLLPPQLRKFADIYRRVINPAVSWAFVGLLFLCVVVAVNVARTGTLSFRAGAVLILAFGALALLLRVIWARRRFASEEQAIRSVLVSTQPKLGNKVLRALHLARREQSVNPGESQELRQLFYERMLARASEQAIKQNAGRKAQLYRRFATLALLGAVVGFGVAPIHAIEGLNVMLAENGIAPMAVQWLERTEVNAVTPSYLGNRKAHLMLDSANLLPEGTQLSVRGRPRFKGRKLVLLDGDQEVDFVEDGTGALIARWELTHSSTVRVAARFGDVLVLEPQVLEIHSQLDNPPVVRLEGAPASYELEKMQKLELRWSAVDDHSLVQVELVLRSAGREERRPLERYPGDKRVGSGGHVLYPDDPFFQRLFLPATVTIEARDNDPRHGNKWGSSAAITVRPPTVGAPQAQRYAALADVRDQWVKVLAERLELEKVERKEQKAARSKLLERIKQLDQQSMGAFTATYGGLTPHRGLVAFGRGQLEKLRRAYRLKKDEIRSTEDVVLALDRALRSLSSRDARDVSKQLGDVAEEAAYGARLAQTSEDRKLGLSRLDLAISVLELGAQELIQLGLLGQDLGSVAGSDLDRLVRARKAEDLFHSELVALHMAARLHRPNPSFGSKGSGGGGGVESGPGMGGGSGSDAQGESSQAQSEFDKLAQDLEELVSEHADSVGRTGAALDGAEETVHADELEAEAKRRAEELRRSVLRLPQPGETPGSSRAAAALSREHTGTMAHELMRLSFEDAVVSGQRAISAAEDALRKGGLSTPMQAQLERALQKLKEHTAWAEEQQKRLSELVEQAAKQALQKNANWEAELAERARRMAAESGEKALLPQEVQERLRQAQSLMNDAASRLQSGKGKDGLELQRKAQALLEEAQTGKTDGEDGEEQAPDRAESSNGRAQAGGGEVPDAEKTNKAEDFRKRVLEGLSKGNGGRLTPAVRRYAEGLLR